MKVSFAEASVHPLDVLCILLMAGAFTLEAITISDCKIVIVSYIQLRLECV